MVTLLHWIYINNKNTWNIYCNGKITSNIKSREDAINKAQTLAFKNSEKLGCFAQILVQNTDGTIELVGQNVSQRLLV